MPTVREHSRFRTAGAGSLFAAVAGKLSVRPPGCNNVDPGEDVLLPYPGGLPGTLDLYIHIDEQVRTAPFKTQSSGFEGIEGFAYLGVDTSTLGAALGDLLPKTVKGVADPPLTLAQLTEAFVHGVVDVRIPAGHAIGAAASVAPGERAFGFAAINQHGPIDPSYTFQTMRTFVEEIAADLDSFLAVAPPAWPVLTATKPDELLTQAAQRRYPWPVLQEARRRLFLPGSTWRAIGNLQKGLLKPALAALTSVDAPSGTPPQQPFAFDNEDWRNAFQLEAVAEHYLNFDDPWAVDTAPVPPSDQKFITVDLIDPGGEFATMVSGGTGKVLLLDGSPDLRHVTPGKDFIHLPADQNPKSSTHLYKITAVDHTTSQVTLDAVPQLTAAGSPWVIRRRPYLVIVDPFGSRWPVSGTAATISKPADTTTHPLTELTVDAAVDLTRINPNFDTIRLANDTGRASKTYRIGAVLSSQIIRVRGAPTLRSSPSPWSIQSGIGGKLPALAYKLGPENLSLTPGWDHYDGTAFLVQGGRVRGNIRTSTYTSRYPPKDHTALSSVRGNRRFAIDSFKSGSDYINFTFAVRAFPQDPLSGAHGVVRPPPMLSNDTVGEARWYFHANVTPGVQGQIRIHYGERGRAGTPDAVQYKSTGSQGCFVSPQYYNLRDVLAEAAREEQQKLNPTGAEPTYSALRWLNHDASRKAWAKYADNKWNNEIIGTLLLIRPAERPLGLPANERGA